MIKQIVLVAIAATAFTSFADVKNTTVAMNAVLKDGSSIKGEFLADKVNGTTAFATSLALDPAIVKTIDFTSTNGESKVELVNGDRFAIKIANNSFAVSSMLGNLTIPRANFRTISLFARSTAAANGGSSDGLIFHCTFDGREATMRPTVGTAEVRILNATFGDGKKGKAVLAQRGLPAVEIKLPPNTFGRKGCIEFWAKLLDGKTEFSTGGDPRFFTMYTVTGGQCGVFEYASNSGNGNRGLCGTIWTGFAATHSGCGHLMPYSDIFHGKPYEDWHHYAISWNTNGAGYSDNVSKSSIRVNLFIDGKKVSTVHEAGFADDAAFEIFGDSISMGIPMREQGPSYNNKSSFLLDELKIWNYDKMTFDL